MSELTTITVDGMTCGHCAASVREEIGEIAGVTDVAVDVESGRVDITSDAALDDTAVTAAVVEAGYTVR
ncbi:heavy-metal-associated domain-containing protein [Gordonia humi]|uniref:Copper ion binding protein n=1 Tax=Gordonia humi TaxID=686429 RepID=A0A840ET40_9ACTN|nr:cation transporter [Gordonia humi]MBB4133524.1 copper ion binding protein [Gordonia humi]